MKNAFMCGIALFSSVGIAQVDAAPVSNAQTSADEFSFPAPEMLPNAEVLWSTRYYIHAVEPAHGDAAIPLLTRDATNLGVSLTNQDFCFGALQGTIAVRSAGAVSIYNVDGLLPVQPVPITKAKCTYRKLKPEVNAKLGRQAWIKLGGNATYGLGVNGLKLVPFRTVAVDRKSFPIGTVLFIPALKGYAFDDNGTKRVHDGYVIAGDVGGGVVGTHIDFFTGNFRGPPPAFVKSNEKDTFKAYVVTNPAITASLKDGAAYRP